MSGEFKIPREYWSTIQITQKDLENLHTYLFERETPLTARDLTLALVESRISSELEADRTKHQSDGKKYMPRDSFQVEDVLVFPALGWKQGRVVSRRQGINPAIQDFEVIAVTFEDGSERMFATNLPIHDLNIESKEISPSSDMNPALLVQEFGSQLEKKVESAFAADEGLVKIAGRWFPKALLIDINQGQLNLAEAVLDMAGGEPLPTEALIRDIELPQGVNPRLAEFSLNYALQDDERFDEVGPAGRVLWCLRRLEPEYVKDVPPPLQYEPVSHDRSVLTEEMKMLESELDDELTPTDATGAHDQVDSLTITLIYPHLRAGTLPMSSRVRDLFPTAHESPRVRFTLVDGKSNQQIPAWVVREHGYVFGLREWYKMHQLMPGSLVEVRRGDNSGEVIVEARVQRSSKDWVRTVMVGTDGGVVFAMLKQAITAEFNDRMTIYVPDFKALDPVWNRQRSFEDLVIMIMRELSKSNPQGHVHAQELYAGVNLLRRTPPAPLFGLLAVNPVFKHVGDLHFRLDEEVR